MSSLSRRCIIDAGTVIRKVLFEVTAPFRRHRLSDRVEDAQWIPYSSNSHSRNFSAFSAYNQFAP